MRRKKIRRFQGTTANFVNRLKNLREQLKKLEMSLPEEVGKSVKGYETRIVEMIQIQLWNGKNGAEMGCMYGDIIRPFYKPSTIRAKRRKGQPFDRVTLYDKGNFYRRMRVYYSKTEGLYIKSTDPKNDKLIKKYGPEIFRLDRANFNALIAIIRNELQKKVKQELLGKS